MYSGWTHSSLLTTDSIAGQLHTVGALEKKGASKKGGDTH